MGDGVDGGGTPEGGRDIDTLELVLGGTRSGKSRRARERARDLPGRVLYLATAWREDPEMEERIRRHRRDRPEEWETVEPPYELVDVARRLQDDPRRVVLMDEFTLWVTDLQRRGHGAEAILERTRRVLDVISAGRCRWIVVSALANRGVVPADADTRRFRDLLGLANQELAGRASRVVEVVAGIARTLK